MCFLLLPVVSLCTRGDYCMHSAGTLFRPFIMGVSSSASRTRAIRIRAPAYQRPRVTYPSRRMRQPDDEFMTHGLGFGCAHYSLRPCDSGDRSFALTFWMSRS
ncbi:hypothetical protein BDV59DRAFT_186196 [Aspergillus ambiguus]|uniref:uncharacterized protein n=1 Tax=Aspergillus ambiguus TaxID=176160 RepID=UPI003CCE3F17